MSKRKKVIAIYLIGDQRMCAEVFGGTPRRLRQIALAHSLFDSFIPGKDDGLARRTAALNDALVALWEKEENARKRQETDIQTTEQPKQLKK